MVNPMEIKKLKYFDLGEEGGLFEALRSDDALFDGKFGQNLVSIVKPGIIKGLHLHHKQTEYTTCIKGDILYVAITDDLKQPAIEKFLIGRNNRLLIKTPPGIGMDIRFLTKKTLSYYTPWISLIIQMISIPKRSLSWHSGTFGTCKYRSLIQKK